MFSTVLQSSLRDSTDNCDICTRTDQQDARRMTSGPARLLGGRMTIIGASE